MRALSLPIKYTLSVSTAITVLLGLPLANGVKEDWTALNDFLAGVEFNASGVGATLALVDVLDEEFETSEGTLTTVEAVVASGDFSLQNVYCADFQLQSELQLYTPSEEEEAIRSGAAVRGMNVNCSADFTWSGTVVSSFGNYDGGIPESGSRKLLLQPSPDREMMSIDFELLWELSPTIVDAGTLRPSQVSLGECAALMHPDALNVEASTPEIGTDGEKLLTTLARALYDKSLMCRVVSGILDTASPGLGNLNGLLDGLVEDRPRDPSLAEAELLEALSGEERDASLRFGESPTTILGGKVLDQVLGNKNNVSSLPAINELVDRLSNSSNGLVNLDLSAVQRSLLGGMVQIGEHVQLTGMNSFQEFSSFAFESTLPYSMESLFKLREFAIMLPTRLTVVEAETTLLDGQLRFQVPYAIKFNFTITLEDLYGSFVNAAATNLDEISEVVSVGQLSNNPFICMSPSIYNFIVSSIEASLEEATGSVSFALSQFEDPGFEALAQNISETANRLYQAGIQVGLTNMTRGLASTLSDIINSSINATTFSDCPAYEAVPGDENELIDFSTGTPQSIRDVIDATASNVNDPIFGLNAIMRELSSSSGSPPGSITFEDGLVLELELEGDKGEKGTAIVNLTRLELGGLDTFESFSILKPVDGDPQRTTLTTVGLEKLQVGFTGTFVVPSQSINEGATLSIELQGVEFTSAMRTLIRSTDVAALTFNQLTRLGCIASVFELNDEEPLRFDSFEFLFQTVSATCPSCLFSTLQQEDLVTTVNRVLTDGSNLVSISLTGNTAPGALAVSLKQLASECTATNPDPSPRENDSSFGLSALLGANAVGVGTVLVMLLWCCIKSCGSHSDVTYERLTEASLAQSWVTPWTHKLFFLVLLSGAIGLFITASIAVGGSLRTKGVLFTESSYDVEGLYDLDLVKKINELNQIGLPSLAVAVALLSGCLSFVRTFTLLICFFLPPQLLSIRKRGSALEWCSILGKWALMDPLLLVLLSVAVNIELAFPEDNEGISFLDERAIVSRTHFKLKTGTYVFFLGFIVLTLANRLLLGFHQNITRPSETGSEAGREKGHTRQAVLRRREALRGHIFPVTAASGHAPLQVRERNLTFCVVASVFVSIAMLLFGLFGTLVTFDYGGVGGRILLIVDASKASKSLSMGGILSGIQADEDSFESLLGSSFLITFLVTILFVIPLLQQCLVAVIFFRRTSLRELRVLTNVLERLASWNSLEVAAISVLTAALYISYFVSFVVEDLCLTIDDFLKTYVGPIGLLQVGEVTCFTVSGQLGVAFYVLFVGSLLSLINVQCMISVAKVAIEDREEEARFRIYGTTELIDTPGRRDQGLGCWQALLSKRLSLAKGLGLVYVRRAPPTVSQSPADRLQIQPVQEDQFEISKFDLANGSLKLGHQSNPSL